MRSDEVYSQLLNRLGCGVVVLDEERTVRIWNDWMTLASGIPQSDATGMPFAMAFPDVVDGRVGRAVDAALVCGRSAVMTAALNERPLLTSKSAPPHSLSVHPLPGPTPGALLVVRDAGAEMDYSERLDAIAAENDDQRQALRRERDRFTHITHFDPVTGLANRHKVRNYLAGALIQAMAQERMGALLLLDLDRFADVNSSIGAGAADQVLRLVATRLAEAVRSVDTVARLGGDEFVVVLDAINSIEEAEAAGHRLLAAFDRPFHVDDRELFLTASIGMTVFPMQDCTADRLLINAETAVGVAKKQGSGGFQTYSGKMEQEVNERLVLHSALRHAVDDGEFVLMYQPQIGFPGDRLIGVEALIRWNHPERGMVSPAEFIPLLEDSALITKVGAWVLQEACRQGVEWHAQGLTDLRISVNVSARQFRGTVLADAVAGALEASGFPAERLELELTESLLMKDVASSNRMLADLKRMGVAIAIDDFGTGYSSLAYLRRFPVDTLKIDRAFCRNITVSGDDLAICRTIISLAKTLELSVVAEGVETAGQLDLLLEAGCDQYQGFFFGRPMPSAELRPWLEARTQRIPNNVLQLLVAAPDALETRLALVPAAVTTDIPAGTQPVEYP